MKPQRTLVVFPYAYEDGRAQAVPVSLPVGVPGALLAALYEHFGPGVGTATLAQCAAAARADRPEADAAWVDAEAAERHLWAVRPAAWGAVLATCGAYEGHADARAHLAPLTAVLARVGPRGALLLGMEHAEVASGVLDPGVDVG